MFYHNVASDNSGWGGVCYVFIEYLSTFCSINNLFISRHSIRQWFVPAGYEKLHRAVLSVTQQFSVVQSPVAVGVERRTGFRSE